MKNIIKFILLKLSKIIYYIIPGELIKKESLTSKLLDNMRNETLLFFQEHIENSLVFLDYWALRENAIKTA